MADDLTTTTTVATIPNATKVATFETTADGHKQLVQTSTFARLTANFTRPADATAYAVGDLVGNSTTAASVTPLTYSTAATAYTTQTAAGFFIRRASIKKTTVSITNAAFRLHMYGTNPSAATGILNGDNGAFSVNDAAYLGFFDIGSMLAHRNFAIGTATPMAGAEVSHSLSSGTTLYGLLECRGAYTPGNAEVFTVELETYKL